jgi:hypothetical protein
MILISNHLLRLHAIDISPDAVIRINVAWVRDMAQLAEYLDIPHDVFLDYPQGRKKPPIATITLDEAIIMANNSRNVKYFALSNAEDALQLTRIRAKLNDTIELVPKIETMRGAHNVVAITQACRATRVMLDKEDLFTDAGDQYEHFAAWLRKDCARIGVKVLELAGVVFDDA